MSGGAPDLIDAQLVASAFAIVFVAELPDKTALASLVLATHLPHAKW